MVAQQFPEMMAGNGGLFFFASILITGLAMGLLYTVLHSSIPGSGWKKGRNYGIMTFFLGGIAFPVMILGYAPAVVAVLEIVTTAIGWIVAGIVVHVIQDKM
jgi:hypothetical protein